MVFALLMLSIVVPLLFGLAKGIVKVSHTGFQKCIPVVFGILLGVILYRGLPFLSNLIPGEPIISGVIVVAVSVAISFVPMLFLRTTVPAILLYCFSTASIGAMLMLVVVDYACYFLRLFNIIKTELPFLYFSSPVDIFSAIVFLIVCLTTAITTTYTNYKVYAEERGYDFEEGRTFYGPILGALLTGLAAAAAYLFLVPEIMRWRITKNVHLIPWWDSLAPFPEEDLASYPITGQACFEPRIYVGMLVVFVLGTIAWYVFVRMKYKRRMI